MYVMMIYIQGITFALNIIHGLNTYKKQHCRHVQKQQNFNSHKSETTLCNPKMGNEEQVS